MKSDGTKSDMKKSGRYSIHSRQAGSTLLTFNMPMIFVFGMAFIFAFLAGHHTVGADPYPSPPAWSDGAGAAIHFPPVPWPNEDPDPAKCTTNCGDWKPYTRFQNDLNDPRTQDPSNGGTAPQNYVNVSSSCIDKSLPSIYYYLYHGKDGLGNDDPTKDVIMFRWRVEQIANNYATGPSPGNFSSTDPWSSGLWTVFFDVDGDGYRDLATHLNGSSGDPSHQIDRLAGIWGNIPSQSIDYINDSANIHMLYHNPTAFTSGNMILNFHNNYDGDPSGAHQPSLDWSDFSTTKSWDYGTTRSKLISTNACNEYFVDYQIPVAMLDATYDDQGHTLNGPKITRSTPISMLFCTANSLNNPFQKDCAINKAWAADPTKPAPFGDYISFNLEDFQQPIVASITGSGCGTISLTAKVNDTIGVDNNGVPKTTVASVAFYYYYDANGNGLVDDDIAGSAWTKAADATHAANSINKWTATWNASAANGLLRGQYIIGVQAVDTSDSTLFDDGMTPPTTVNRTFSYLTQAQVNALGGKPAGENWFANPDFTGTQVLAVGLDVNDCGLPPPFVKNDVSPVSTTTGATVDITVTVENSLLNDITVSSISDILPEGFSYAGSASGACTSDPPSQSGNTLTWTCSPSATVPARVLNTNGTISLSFQATASSTVGTYSNSAAAQTSYSTSPLLSDPVQIGVGAPRLSIAKSASPLSVVPGSTITYTITYSNDSAVSTNTVVLTDDLPTGLTWAGSCTPACDAGPAVPTWTIGNLAAGEGPYTVQFTATVASNFAGTNTATINAKNPIGDALPAATASASVYVNVPRPQLTLKNIASTSLVAPGSNVTFTITYANTGDAAATNSVITDAIPIGFTFVSVTSSPAANSTNAPNVGANGTVTWNFNSIAASATGTVTLVVQATNPYIGTSNPVTDTASIVSTEITTPVTDSAEVGVTESGTVCTYYFFSDSAAGYGPASPVVNKLAKRDVPTTPQVYTVHVTEVEAEVARFYEDDFSNFVDFSTATLAGQFVYNKRSAAQGGQAGDTDTAKLTLTAELYDYNPGDGSIGNGTTLNTPIGTVSKQDAGVTSSPFTLDQVTLAGHVNKGHRLMWLIKAKTATGKTTTLDLTLDSGVMPVDTLSTYSKVCSPPPANLVLEDSVNSASVNVTGSGRTLVYTLSYSNTSATTPANNAIIVDTLPLSGVTYGSCSVSGNPHFNRCTPGAGLVTFDNTAGATIPGGDSGSVTITVNVADDLTGTSSIVNSTQIESTQTTAAPEGGATATTSVIGGDNPAGTPDIVINMSADKTLLVPGNMVTYSLSVVNAGAKTATNVIVTDDIPDQTYFTYVGGSITGGNSRDATVPGTLSWTINSMAPGDTATLTFRMQAGTSGGGNPPPNGVTSLNNSASAGYSYSGGGPGSSLSNTVTVSISTNPNLTISSAVLPLVAHKPGDILTYNLTVKNIGNGSATDVAVYDPIPGSTSYFAIVSASDDDGGIWSSSYDPSHNRVVFSVDSLGSDKTAILSFQVKVSSPLPSGSTQIDNTATVSAGNAASRESTVSTTAQAAPILTLANSGPAQAAYPTAVLTAPASSSTTLFVNDTSQFTTGQHVLVGGTTTYITTIAGDTITVANAVSALSGSDVIGGITYQITYQNTGDAVAANTDLSNPLPGGSSFAWASDGGADIAGTVTWDIGSLDPGTGGTVRVVIIPGAPGTITDVASIICDGLAPVNSQAVTIAGGLKVTKTTSSPTISAGSTAIYIIEVENTLADPATGVEVTDTLPSGFTYASTTSILIDGANATAATMPLAGESLLTWKDFNPATIPGGKKLVLTFVANVDSLTGAATYQNETGATYTNFTNARAVPFDPLQTTEEDVTVLASGTGIVDGYVFMDTNENHTFNIGETPLTGVSVSITDDTGTAYVEYTDSSGYFSRVVSAGQITVYVAEPAGKVLASGSTNPASDIVPGGGTLTVNTGFVNASGNIGTVTGTVFNDADGNQIKAAGESGMVGVTVQLWNAAGDTLIRTALTGVTGVYGFTSVPVGTYRVYVVPPIGYGATTTNPVTGSSVTNGGTTTVDFGFQHHSDVTISGTTTLGGVTLSYDSTSTTSDGSGNYSFTVPYNWSGTVTPSKTGYTFTPANRPYSSLTASQTSQDYSPLVTISGTTTLGAVTLSYDSTSTTSDGSGNYSFTVPYNWSGTVTPSKTGYTFTPANRSYSSLTASQTSQNYTPNAATYTISGTTTLTGVTLSYNDGGAKTATSGSGGSYSFSVPSGWSGTVTPSLAGYTFTPPSRSYTNLAANQINQNYTPSAATYTISGSTTLTGVTLSYNDGGAKTATSGAGGSYSFTVPYNWSGTVTPSLTGYTFTPTNRTYSNLAASQTSQDYTPNAIKGEPTNHPTGFTATGQCSSRIVTSWTDSTGSVVPDGYLVMCNKTGTFTAPVDGTTQSDDTDLSNGSGVKSVPQGTHTFTWTGLSASTRYYFKIFPYTNSGSNINYKTNGTPPTANAMTSAPTTWTVVNINDSGAGSLRYAVDNSCSGDLIVFNFPDGNNNPHTIPLTSGPLDIDNKDLTITGTGADKLTVSGNGNGCASCTQCSRVFVITGTSQVSISDLTVSKGKNSALEGSPYLGNGAGIYLSSVSTLTLTQCTITENCSEQGGGGIYSEGTLNLGKCTVSYNSAKSDGGGIAATGIVTLTTSTVSGNTTDSGGAGIYVGAAGNLTLNQCTISANSAIFNNPSIPGNGGGIHAESSVYMKNTILAANAVSSSRSGTDCWGTIVSQGYNLIGNTGGCTLQPGGGGTGDIFSSNTDILINPQLSSLANNGGPTKTHAILSGSPAKDAADPSIAAGTATDQRGVERVKNGGHALRMDIGAFEYTVPTVVGLASFTAKGLEDRVLLEWVTMSELDTVGFDLWRKTAGEKDYSRITSGIIPSKGDALHGAGYQYEDMDVLPKVTYSYMLEDIDSAGEGTFHGPVSVTVEEKNSITLISPREGSVLGKAALPRFSWENSELGRFRLELSNSRDFTSRVVSIPEKDWTGKNFCTPTTKEWKAICTLSRKGTNLFWRVEGEDKQGKQAVSQTSSFTLQ